MTPRQQSGGVPSSPRQTCPSLPPQRLRQAVRHPSSSAPRGEQGRQAHAARGRRPGAEHERHPPEPALPLLIGPSQTGRDLLSAHHTRTTEWSAPVSLLPKGPRQVGHRLSTP